MDAIARYCFFFLESSNDAKSLSIALEPAILFHAIIQRLFTNVSEWGVPDIVGKASKFHQIRVDALVVGLKFGKFSCISIERNGYGLSDLRDLQGMGKPVSEKIPLRPSEKLRLTLKPPKRRAVN